MPKAHKKRGRREEKKRKREEETDVYGQSTRRYKSNNNDEAEIKLDIDPAKHEDEPNESRSIPGELPFYGMLDDEEQEYFKRADTMLELDRFPNPEERELFLANVYKEADGKELKIANSQGCSRLMERLILMSTSSQLKALFKRFSGQFIHLVQHRFASHCCETLFIQAAPLVSQELTAPLETAKPLEEEDEADKSMENLFLSALDELAENLGYHMTHSFASHTLRVLLVVLSGRPIMDANTKTLIKSKKAESITSANSSVETSMVNLESRIVPNSFNDALDRTISSMIAGLDTTYLRALATHPTGNPVLQLLIELEFTRFGKGKARDTNSLFHKLLPDDPPEEGTESASFINGLLYDTVGSRLLETIIQHAPGKTFKSLYKSLFRERLGSLARNEIASYPAIKVLERLSKEEMQHAVEQICPLIEGLVERSRTAVIKALIERCHVRGVDTRPIASAIRDTYGNEPIIVIRRMLSLDASEVEGVSSDRQKQIEDQDAGKIHGSLLAQSMLQTPGPLREVIMDGLLTIDTPILTKIAKDRSATHVLQAALTCHDQDPTSKFRRTIVQRLAPHAADLAMDIIASHVIDAIWHASADLQHPRQQLALELLRNEDVIRQTPSGKAVWRNWKMELFKRNKALWVYGDDVQAKPVVAPTNKPLKSDASNPTGEKVKTPLELARERFAKGTPPGRKGGKVGLSGGNAVAVKGKALQAR